MHTSTATPHRKPLQTSLSPSNCSSMSADLMQFPQNVLVLVLRHIGQAERMMNCALVGKDWAEAAAMATDDMLLQYRWDDPADYMPYLQKHGQHVTALSCMGDRAYDEHDFMVKLPCSNLRELDIEHCALQLGPSAGSGLQAAEPGLLQELTALTKLVMNMQEVSDFEHPAAEGLACLTALTALPALQHFHLSVGAADDFPDYVHGPYDVVPSCVFVGLTHLTYLSLEDRLTVESLEHISCLSKLQDLVLYFDYPIPDSEGAAGLQQQQQQPFRQLQQLTCLVLNIPDYQLTSSSSSPAFAGCTALQVLQLWKCKTDASALKGLTSLRRLALPVRGVVSGGALGLDAALGHVSCMQALESLQLSQAVKPALAGAAAYRAITASAQLTSLWLSDIDMPAHAWRYLFPTGHVLAGLTSLRLSMVRPDQVLTSYDLRAMVACCPALHELKAGVKFEPGVSLLPLLQLRCMTYLEWSNVATGGAQSVGVLGQLVQLSWLSICAGDALTTPDMLQLTSLWNLRTLSVRDMPDLMRRKGLGKAPDDGTPDLWYRLLLGCAATAECQAALDQQLPDIVQQPQQTGYDLIAFDLARSEGQARARVVKALADLAQAQANLAEAQSHLAQIQEQQQQQQQQQ